MRRSERHTYILNQLLTHHSVNVTDLCKALRVSDMTIRRDLTEMDRDGLLKRVHGGAVSRQGLSYEPPFFLRQNQQRESKERIGRKAAEQVIDGDTIALDVGTTALEIARALRVRRNLTIVTASLQVANEIVSNSALDSGTRLIITGGMVRPGELSLVGPYAEHIYHDLHVDKAFIGVAGIHLRTGVTEYNLEDAQVKRAMLATANKVIAAADGSKFGHTAFASVCDLDVIDAVITDSSADPETISGLRAQGIEIIYSD